MWLTLPNPGSGKGFRVKLLIAIPAFNEEATIADAIKDIRNNMPEADILVINDRSTDKTNDVVRAMDVRCLQFSFNMGVGAAMRAAFKLAHEEDYSHVLQFDADGQHSAIEALKLISFSDEADIVIGSRFLDTTEYKVNKVRRLAMKILALVIGRRVGQKLTDVTSGFRLTGREAVHFYSLNYPPEYLGDTVESILMAGENGFKLKEVSVNMYERKGGQPSQNLYKLIVYLARVGAVILISFLQYKKSRKSI
jgi:glycosyltransferase involved in cell wall biosynthesis